MKVNLYPTHISTWLVDARPQQYACHQVVIQLTNWRKIKNNAMKNIYMYLWQINLVFLGYFALVPPIYGAVFWHQYCYSIEITLSHVLPLSFCSLKELNLLTLICREETTLIMTRRENVLSWSQTSVLSLTWSSRPQILVSLT